MAGSGQLSTLGGQLKAPVTTCDTQPYMAGDGHRDLVVLKNSQLQLAGARRTAVVATTTASSPMTAAVTVGAALPPIASASPPAAAPSAVAM